jgi:hypothetical protein
VLPGQGQREGEAVSVYPGCGVAQALREVHFDKAAFVKGGGEYDWSKETEVKGCETERSKELEW